MRIGFIGCGNMGGAIIGGIAAMNDIIVYDQNTAKAVELKEKYNINIEIPPGYKVESLPESVKVSTVDGIASFSINILSVGNKIQIAVTKEISKAIVSADYYDVLKDFFQQVLDKQNEKIILIKV